ncbi:MAG: hypothetical protein IPJ07_23055 [Acidobacteria bacterium]|nr:hypothetical protein [Acidobacteriota bacterium]
MELRDARGRAGGTVRCTTPVLAASNPGPTSVNFTLGVKVAASYQGTTINNIATVTTATSQERTQSLTRTTE